MTQEEKDMAATVDRLTVIHGELEARAAEVHVLSVGLIKILDARGIDFHPRTGRWRRKPKK